MVGVALVALRRGVLAFGALTILVGLNGVAMILMRGHAPLVVQLVFAGVALASGFTLYFVAVLTLAGTWWTVHLLSGSVLLAGIVGVLLSFVFTEREA